MKSHIFHNIVEVQQDRVEIMVDLYDYVDFPREILAGTELSIMSFKDSLDHKFEGKRIGNLEATLAPFSYFNTDLDLKEVILSLLSNNDSLNQICYLSSVRVSEDHRRNGFLRNMLKHLYVHLNEQSFVILRVESKENVSSNNLFLIYNKLGFIRINSNSNFMYKFL